MDSSLQERNDAKKTAPEIRCIINLPVTATTTPANAYFLKKPANPRQPNAKG